MRQFPTQFEPEDQADMVEAQAVENLKDKAEG
jgi:hypothetical protein